MFYTINCFLFEQMQIENVVMFRKMIKNQQKNGSINVLLSPAVQVQAHPSQQLSFHPSANWSPPSPLDSGEEAETPPHPKKKYPQATCNIPTSWHQINTIIFTHLIF